jgi:succinate-semialdehyde dehydrogenase/glutarate-semialdehyde dehydrogenase
VLIDVTTDMTLYAEETFGPVVAVYPYDSDDEAVVLANDSVYGLHAVVWTGDPARGRRLARRLRFGTVGVNDAYVATWGSTAAPMGGFGQIGAGRRHGPEGITKYTEAQTIAVQRGLPLAPIGEMTAEAFAGATLTLLRLLKRLPGLR